MAAPAARTAVHSGTGEQPNIEDCGGAAPPALLNPEATRQGCARLFSDNGRIKSLRSFAMAAPSSKATARVRGFERRSATGLGLRTVSRGPG
jgi:hypothetical protein